MVRQSLVQFVLPSEYFTVFSLISVKCVLNKSVHKIAKEELSLLKQEQKEVAFIGAIPKSFASVIDCRQELHFECLQSMSVALMVMQ